jgi:hypothetical protein
VRSVAVLILAVAGFVLFSIRTHHRSDVAIEAEAKVPAQIRLEGKRGVQPNLPEKNGYAYEWIESEGEDEVAILRARPTEPGRTGAIWFVTIDGIEVYEFDATLFQADAQGPPTTPIRRFLSQPSDQRDADKAPTGWKQVP